MHFSRHINVVALSAVLLCVVLTHAMCKYEAPAKPSGEYIRTVETLADGSQIRLYMQRETKQKDASEVGAYDAGTWYYEMYFLTLRKPGGTEDVLWRRGTSYGLSEAKRMVCGIRVIDVDIQTDKAIILSSQGGIIIREIWSRDSNGVWYTDSSLYHQSVPSVEIPGGRMVVKGEILPNDIVQLELQNGCIEKWAFDVKPAVLVDRIKANPASIDSATHP